MPNSEIYVYDRYSRNSEKELRIHDRISPDITARFAMAMIERWALVAGQPDGEDTAGRSKLGLMPPAKIVQQACDVSEQAIAEFRKRGWMIEVASAAELFAPSADDEPKKK